MAAVRRVYVPVSMKQLHDLRDDRRFDARELIGFAVTDELRASGTSGGDEEDYEYRALQQAASQAAGDGGRVVCAADLESHQVQVAMSGADSAHRTHDARVRIGGGLDLRRVMSLHVLDPVGERDELADLDLSWFDVTELANLIDVLGEPGDPHDRNRPEGAFGSTVPR
ncbi:MAG: hypothetical protein M3Y49_14615 [Actinomycetota bacterium]|nr:hypothetical protein [Actinomycetota bacterium]